MNEILLRQLAADYCCSEEDVRDRHNHFTVHEFREERRKYRESKECILKIADVNGKLLFTGHEPMIGWCGERFRDTGSEWFFDAATFRSLDARLTEEGFRIMTVRPFFISDTVTPVEPDGFSVRWYEADDIEEFRGGDRFKEAYTFDPDAPDVLGVAAVRGEQILGMAGASADSPSMWQIGINVEPEARGTGVARTLVTLLKNEILQRGKLPYYSTAMSHLASQRVALGSGFKLSWAELLTGRAE
ncbi:MAG: GNAT family N-acetyltransferase [Blautia sp.]|nr:GNAT family N-acetyltransferase [Blautia sp.]